MCFLLLCPTLLVLQSNFIVNCLVSSHTPVQLKWLVEPKGQLKVQVGRPLHVPCVADGQPAPRTTWTKLEGDTPVATQLGHELRFNAIGQDDSGLYECRATNGVEEDLAARIRLDVLGEYLQGHEISSGVSQDGKDA